MLTQYARTHPVQRNSIDQEYHPQNPRTVISTCKENKRMKFRTRGLDITEQQEYQVSLSAQYNRFITSLLDHKPYTPLIWQWWTLQPNHCKASTQQKMSIDCSKSDFFKIHGTSCKEVCKLPETLPSLHQLPSPVPTNTDN